MGNPDSAQDFPILRADMAKSVTTLRCQKKQYGDSPLGPVEGSGLNSPKTATSATGPAADVLVVDHACGHPGADVRPLFERAKMGTETG